MSKQYMLVVVDNLRHVREFFNASHFDLLNRELLHTANSKSYRLATEYKEVRFIYYDVAAIDSIRGTHYTQAIITQYSDEYSQKLVLSRLRGKGERMFQVGYKDMWEVVGLVNKFLGVSDE